ncbi:Serine incorporator 3, partial [Cucurbita argyrosperma subsp. argyrosperma]
MSQGGEGRGVHTRQGNSEFVSWETPNADYASEKKKSLRVRYVYAVIFLMTNLIAWFIRDYGKRIIPQIRYLKSCGVGGQDCFLTLGVLRIFFFLMFLSTSRTRKLHEPRNVWHSSWWSLKFIVFIVSMLVPFFFPPALIQLYGMIFLLLQLVSVIQFISWWNKYWMPDEKMKQICSLGLFTSTIFYIASFCGIGLMYSLYVPKLRCVLNIFFISWTLILLIVMMVVSLHSKVNRGLLSSGIMASYVVFLCWSAIRSEPATEKCSAQKQGSGNSDWITSFLIAICAVVMATFSTGIDSQSFQVEHGCWMDKYMVWTLISPVVRQAKVRNHEEGVQEANGSAIP